MIKDGNYYYLNFDEHKEKFIDVFTEYYGSEFAETIRNRINSITYVPFMKFDYVSSYYGKLMDKYKDEIIAEFKKISGHDVKKEDEDLIWKDGGSSIFASEIDGHNLENCDFLFEVKNEYLTIRDKVITALGLDKSADLVEQFKCEARNLKKALAEVEKRHPCQVFNDLERGIRNRNDSLQKFLVNVNKYFLNLSEHDIELINSPDFDTYDREDLNSKYLMFGTLIGAGMALTAVWNGAPALCPGAMGRQAYLSRALQAVSLREFPGSSLMGNGAGADMRTSPPVTLSFSIGTLMVLLTMWVSSLVQMAAGFTR